MMSLLIKEFSVFFIFKVYTHVGVRFSMDLGQNGVIACTTLCLYNWKPLLYKALF